MNLNSSLSFDVGSSWSLFGTSGSYKVSTVFSNLRQGTRQKPSGAETLGEEKKVMLIVCPEIQK